VDISLAEQAYRLTRVLSQDMEILVDMDRIPTVAVVGAPVLRVEIQAVMAAITEAQVVNSASAALLPIMQVAVVAVPEPPHRSLAQVARAVAAQATGSTHITVPCRMAMSTPVAVVEVAVMKVATVYNRAATVAQAWSSSVI
jgi:hypothetical protein